MPDAATASRNPAGLPRSGARTLAGAACGPADSATKQPHGASILSVADGAAPPAPSLRFLRSCNEGGSGILTATGHGVTHRSRAGTRHLTFRPATG